MRHCVLCACRMRLHPIGRNDLEIEVTWQTKARNVAAPLPTNGLETGKSHGKPGTSGNYVTWYRLLGVVGNGCIPVTAYLSPHTVTASTANAKR